MLPAHGVSLPFRGRDLVALALFVAVNAAVSAIGGWITSTSVGGWYQTLAKPPFNPPDWLFAPVWSALYLMIALAGWRAWQRGAGRELRLALTVYALQLALNLCWSFVFFGARLVGAALAEITALLAAVLANALLFRRIDAAAGWLLAPYAAWVAFALLLNAEIWRLN